MKKISCILLALLMLLLSACVHEVGPADPTDVPKTTAAATDAPTAAPGTTASPADIQYLGDLSYDPETDYDPRFGSFMTVVIDAGDVFYWHGEECYIRYCDKLGGDWGVLCGKPECVHDNGNAHWHNNGCNGFMGEIGPLFWKYRDKFYYVNEWEAKDEGLGVLYRMNLDGSGHEKLGMFPVIHGSFAEAMEPQCFYCHRGLLYTRTMFSDVFEGEPIQRTGYYVMNIDGSDQKTIYESDESYYGFMTFMGEYCYVLDYSDREVGEDEYVIWIKMMRWSPNTEKTEIIYEGSEMMRPNEGELFMKDGDIYCPSMFVMHEGKRAVMRFHEGKWEEMLNFDDPDMRWTVICVSDGVTIARNFVETDPDSEDYDREAKFSTDMDIWIKDFDDNTLYKGPLPTGWKERPEVLPGMRLIQLVAFGDSSTVYMLLHLMSTGEDITETNLFLRYDITENGLAETVIGVTQGGAIKD